MRNILCPYCKSGSIFYLDKKEKPGSVSRI